MLPNKIYAGFDKNTHLESYCTEKKGKCQTEYIRKDLVEHIIRGALGPQDALNKIRSL